MPHNGRIARLTPSVSFADSSLEEGALLSGYFPSKQ